MKIHIRVLIAAFVTGTVAISSAAELSFSDAAIRAEALLSDRFGERAQLVTMSLERVDGKDPVYVARFEPDITTDIEKQARKYHVIVVQMDREASLEMREDTESRVIRRTLIRSKSDGEE